MTDAAATPLVPGRVHATRRVGLHLLLGLLLYGAGANVGAGWVVVLAAMLFATVPFAWVATRRRVRRVSVSRRPGARDVGTTARPVPLRLVVHAPGRGLAVVDDDLAAVGVSGTDLLLHADATLPRGRVEGAPVRVEVQDVFGLFRATASGDVDLRAPLVVRPFPRSDTTTTTAATAALDDDATVTRRGRGVDVDGIREYRAGDPVAAVHWRASVRGDALLVRELHAPVDEPLRVVLAPKLWDTASLDLAAELALGLVHTRGAALAADGQLVHGTAAAADLLAALPPHGWAKARPLAALPPDDVPGLLLAPAAGGVLVRDARASDDTDAVLVPFDRPDPSATPPDAGTARGGLRERIRHVNRTVRPEHSVAVRLTVLAAVELGVLAVLAAGAADPATAVAALLLLPVGAAVSHRRRRFDNFGIKLALTIGVLVVMAQFLGDVRVAQSIDDTRTPLATLFLAIQVLHGFDLPQRRDLGFTLASSLTLVALAGASTHDGTFAVLLLGYTVVAAASLVALQASAARERADALARGVRARWRGGDPEVDAPNADPDRLDLGAVRAAMRGNGRAFVRSAVPAVAAGMVLFLLLPRTSGSQLGGLPFDGFPGSPLGGALISNDAFGGGRDVTSGPTGFTPSSYVGFSEYADLRTVGELRDDPVLRVRADRPRLWRGVVFDVYDGAGWRRTATEPSPTFGRPVTIRVPDALTQSSVAEVVQTYELLDDTPNLLFAASDPIEVWHSAGQATVWDDGTLTTSAEQDEGTIYSIRSRIVTTPPALLRDLPGPVAADPRWTQLPADLPARVEALSAELTDGIATPYARAEAVQAWLGDHVEYTLDAPPPGTSGDLVDHFLFETRAGWCEPIASAMVVLLRSSGVEARFATGFQPGSRNPITGVFDVTLSDAHAWVEVHVPGEGWIPFDPTGAVPSAVSSDAPSRIPLVDLVGKVAAWVTGAITAFLAATPPPVLALLLVLAVVTAGFTGRRWQARRRTASAEAAAVAAAALAMRRPFDDLRDLAAQVGLTDTAHLTPREVTARLSAVLTARRVDVPAAALDVLVRDEESRRYGRDGALPGSPDAVSAALRSADDAVTAAVAALTPV